MADAQRDASDAALAERVRGAAEAERLARAAEAARGKAEEGLPPLREESAIAEAVLQRLVLQREALDDEERRVAAAIETLAARIAQLDRDIEREHALSRDAGDTIARLEDEATRLGAEDEGHEDRLAGAAAAAHEAAQVLQEREAGYTRLTEDAARLAARHQSAQRMVEDEKKTVERGEAEAARADQAAEAAKAAEAGAAAAFGAAEAALDVATKAAAEAEAALAAADEERAATAAREAEARAGRSEAEGEMSALKAEVAALARLVDRDTAEGGQVLDMLRVADGYEKALGAALADDLRAPAVEDDAATGWALMPAYPKAQLLPAGVAALTNHVTVPEVLARRLAQVGLVARADGARLQKDLLPGQRLVSVEGDLWRWDGFRAGAEDAPSAAALRLKQLNRLEELKQELEGATARAEGAARAHEMLKTALAEVSALDARARDVRRAADQRVTEASRALSKSEAERSIAAGKLESARLAMRRHQDEATAARGRLKEAEGALAALDDLDAARAAVEELKVTVEAARMTMMTRRTGHDELRRAGEDRARRLAAIAKELQTWKSRADTAGGRVADIETRKSGSEAELAEARKAPEALAAQRGKLADEIGRAETRRSAAGDALAAGETALRGAVDAERQAERAASEAREARAGAEARAESATEAVSVAAERITEELETTPEALLEKLGDDPATMPGAAELETEVARLKRQRDALGAVNLRAEEDAREVEAEHKMLVEEKTDLEEAIRALRSGIASLNREGRERILTAFEQVNSNFSMLFKHLFGGGEAKLVMVESEDPLDAGLEIMCQPPGKKLSTLSLLSGGEQTLTAMALIFAVFLANPAPICVLDEVDAPLDDANVNRFCDLLEEMTRRTETRFLIITHHAVTMARMDRLFGVTMGEQGVSQLVSVDLRKAEALVA